MTIGVAIARGAKILMQVAVAVAASEEVAGEAKKIYHYFKSDEVAQKEPSLVFAEVKRELAKLPAGPERDAAVRYVGKVEEEVEIRTRGELKISAAEAAIYDELVILGSYVSRGLSPDDAAKSAARFVCTLKKLLREEAADVVSFVETRADVARFFRG